MIELLRKFLPYLLVGFFLFMANKKPLYLLGIPFLMFMSASIFFENAKPFRLPGSILNQLNIIWLVVLWAVAKILSPNMNKRSLIQSNFTILDLGMIAGIIISIAGFFTAYNEYYPITTEIPGEFVLEISIFIAYFILKDWFSSNTREDVTNFLYTIVIVNSIAAFLFILHQGLHISLYTTEEYLTASVEGKEITRSFWFMPQFLPFSVIFLLVFKNKYGLIGMGLLGINFLAIFITYTVSAVVIATLMVILYFILTGLKNNQIGKAFKNILLYALAGLVGLFIMAKLLPANTTYLMSRFSDLSESSYTYKEPNTLEIRFMYTKEVLRKIDQYKMVFGMGPLTEIQSEGVVEMKAATADMVWVGVIYRWGLVGLGIFVCLYLFTLFKSFIIFIKSESNLSNLALVLFLYTISQILESFVSWTFLSGHGITIGLWYFAVMTALLGFQKADQKESRMNLAHN